MKNLGFWAVLFMGEAALLTQGCGSEDSVRHAREEDGGAAGEVATGGAAAEVATGGAAAEALGGQTSATVDGIGGAGAASLGRDGGASAVAPGNGGAASDFVPPAPRLALGRAHSCARKLDDTVVCWGRDDHGELGDGNMLLDPPNGSAAPVVVTGLEGVSGLATGAYHACALGAGATPLVCWGAGYDGQLGDGDLHETDGGGVALIQALDLPNVKQVIAGGNHSCVLLADGSAECWGDNLFGQLGDGTQDRSAVPVAVKDLSGIVQLSTGSFQTCALLDDGSVKCWGSGGTQGGSVISLLKPTLIDGVEGATALVSGGDFSCAVVAGGAVKCWGEGDEGELGDGSENDTNTTPVTVSGLHDVVQLSAGEYHACALERDRSVFCWGKAEFGELGDGVAHNGFPNYLGKPVAASVFDDVVEVRCGGDHTCVVTSDNRVLCAGRGSYGQLGDGKFYDKLPYGALSPVDALEL